MTGKSIPKPNGSQALLIMPGGHSGEAIPVPIPNTEVKLSNADDTAAKWESRKLPGFFFTYELQCSLVAENYE